jgi:isoleucyl-tRNA synthetase
MTTIRDAHSWRSKAPVIRRATPQWFISMDKPGPNGKTLRENALEGHRRDRILPGRPAATACAPWSKAGRTG